MHSYPLYFDSINPTGTASSPSGSSAASLPRFVGWPLLRRSSWAPYGSPRSGHRCGSSAPRGRFLPPRPSSPAGTWPRLWPRRQSTGPGGSESFRSWKSKDILFCDKFVVANNSLSSQVSVLVAQWFKSALFSQNKGFCELFRPGAPNHFAVEVTFRTQKNIYFHFLTIKFGLKSQKLQPVNV